VIHVLPERSVCVLDMALYKTSYILYHYVLCCVTDCFTICMSLRFINVLAINEYYYSAPHCSHCKRCTSYGNFVRLSVRLSVCPSVHLSHAGIVSKRRRIARCSLHYRIKNVSSFVKTKKNIAQGRPLLLKSWLELTYPLLIAASLDKFWLVAPQP